MIQPVTIDLREFHDRTITINGVSVDLMKEKLIEHEDSLRDTKLNRIQELCVEHLEYGMETPAHVIHVCQLGTKQVLDKYYEKIQILNSATPRSIYYFYKSMFPNIVDPDWTSEGF